MEDKMIDSIQCEHMQNNEEITGDYRHLYIHCSVVNDLLAHWKDLGVTVNRSMKMSALV